MDSNNHPQQENDLPPIKANRYFSPLKVKSRRGYCSRKNIIQKYYGRKILFIEKPRQFAAAMNRSKYFLRFKLYEKAIDAGSFKSLANIILLRTDIVLKYYSTGWGCHRSSQYYPNIHPLLLKKALRGCKNPRLKSPQLKHLQHLFHLKSLTLHVTNGSYVSKGSMSKASKVIRKLRLLQSLNIKYLNDYNQFDPHLPIKLKAEPVVWYWNDKTGPRFFYKISKLPRLQRLILQTSLKTLQEQSSAVQQDFVDFYLRPHRFKLETEVYTNSSLDIQELTAKNMTSILKATDILSIHLGVSRPAKENPYMCQSSQGDELSKQEEMKILKQGKKSVKLCIFYKEKVQVNIGCLLTRCENLVSLYLKVAGIETLWDQNYGDLSSKLETVVLDLSSLGLKYEILSSPPSPRFDLEEKIYEIANGGRVKFHSGLIELLKKLKTGAGGLETLTVFMCYGSFKKSWLQPKSFKELHEKMVEEKVKEFFEELESFEKLHRIDICQWAGDKNQYVDRALAAKSLKTVNVRSCWKNC